MNELNIALVAIGGIVLLIGLVSDLFRRTWWAAEPLTALVCGILLSPTVFELLHPTRWGIAQETLIEQATRLTLAIGLMGVALRLPKNYTLRHWRSLLVLTVLLLRRLPAIFLLNQLIKPLKNTPDVLFMGWFGPIGVAALFYASFSLHKTGVEAVWTVTSSIICASLIAHGLTSTAFTKLYGKHFQQHQSSHENG